MEGVEADLREQVIGGRVVGQRQAQVEEVGQRDRDRVGEVADPRTAGTVPFGGDLELRVRPQVAARERVGDLQREQHLERRGDRDDLCLAEPERSGAVDP